MRFHFYFFDPGCKDSYIEYYGSDIDAAVEWFLSSYPLYAHYHYSAYDMRDKTFLFKDVQFNPYRNEQ